MPYTLEQAEVAARVIQAAWKRFALKEKVHELTGRRSGKRVKKTKPQSTFADKLSMIKQKVTNWMQKTQYEDEKKRDEDARETRTRKRMEKEAKERQEEIELKKAEKRATLRRVPSLLLTSFANSNDDSMKEKTEQAKTLVTSFANSNDDSVKGKTEQAKTLQTPNLMVTFVKATDDKDSKKEIQEEVLKLMEERQTKAKRETAAVVIQSHVRKFLTRKKNKKMLDLALLIARRKIAAVRTIQRYYRGFCVRSHIPAVVEMRTSWQTRSRHSSNSMQNPQNESGSLAATANNVELERTTEAAEHPRLASAELKNQEDGLKSPASRPSDDDRLQSTRKGLSPDQETKIRENGLLELRERGEAEDGLQNRDLTTQEYKNGLAAANKKRPKNATLSPRSKRRVRLYIDGDTFDPNTDDGTHSNSTPAPDNTNVISKPRERLSGDGESRAHEAVANSSKVDNNTEKQKEPETRSLPPDLFRSGASQIHLSEERTEQVRPFIVRAQSWVRRKLAMRRFRRGSTCTKEPVNTEPKNSAQQHAEEDRADPTNEVVEQSEVVQSTDAPNEDDGEELVTCYLPSMRLLSLGKVLPAKQFVYKKKDEFPLEWSAARIQRWYRRITVRRKALQDLSLMELEKEVDEQELLDMRAAFSVFDYGNGTVSFSQVCAFCLSTLCFLLRGKKTNDIN